MSLFSLTSLGTDPAVQHDLLIEFGATQETFGETDFEDPDNATLKERFPLFSALEKKARNFICLILNKEFNEYTQTECVTRAGYTVKHPKQKSTKLLYNPKIKAAMEELKTARSEITLPDKDAIMHFVASRMSSTTVSDAQQLKWTEMYVKLRGYYEAEEIIHSVRPTAPRLNFTDAPPIPLAPSLPKQVEEESGEIITPAIEAPPDPDVILEER